jgi:hypothetical protein
VERTKLQYQGYRLKHMVLGKSALPITLLDHRNPSGFAGIIPAVLYLLYLLYLQNKLMLELRLVVLLSMVMLVLDQVLW